MNLKGVNDLTSEEFWAFSLDFYSIAAHQEALIWLQDHAQLNVNLVLLIFYSAINRHSFNNNKIKCLQKSIKELDSLTSNLREERRSHKANKIQVGQSDYKDAYYRELLAKELMLEKQQQTTLIETVLCLNKCEKTDELSADQAKSRVSEMLKLLIVTDKTSRLAAETSMQKLLEGMIQFSARKLNEKR